MKKTFDVVHELTSRAATLRPGPRASVEKLIPAAASYFADLESAEHDEMLSQFGRWEKAKGSLKTLKAVLSDLRSEKFGHGSGAYRLRIKAERDGIAKKAIKREPDARTQAALDRRAERLLRSLESLDALELQTVFWRLPAEDREILEEAGTRILRLADGTINVEPWISPEVAQESRAQRLAALDPETAALIKELEADARDIEHFENLLEGICEQAVGVPPLTTPKAAVEPVFAPRDADGKTIPIPTPRHQ